MHRSTTAGTRTGSGREMGIRVYGHYGAPIVVFPTSGGDEREYEGQGMIDALAHHIDAGQGEALLRELRQQRVLVQQAGPPAAPQLRAGDVRRLHRARGGALRPRPLPDAGHRHHHHRHLVRRLPRGQHAASSTPTCSGAAWPCPASTTSAASWTGTTTTTSTSTTPSTTWRAWPTPGTCTTSRQSDIRLATGHGPFEDSGPTLPAVGGAARAGHPALAWTTGGPTAATTGRTGSTR